MFSLPPKLCAQRGSGAGPSLLGLTSHWSLYSAVAMEVR